MLSFGIFVFWGGDPSMTRTWMAISHLSLNGLPWNLVYVIAYTMSRCNQSLGDWRSVLVFLFCGQWSRHNQKVTETRTVISHLLLNYLPWKLAYRITYTIPRCNQSLGAWSSIFVFLFCRWWSKLDQKLNKLELPCLVHFSMVCYGNWWIRLCILHLDTTQVWEPNN